MIFSLLVKQTRPIYLLLKIKSVIHPASLYRAVIIFLTAIFESDNYIDVATV